MHVRVAAYHHHPFPLVAGGGIKQAKSTVDALVRAGTDAHFLDYHDEYDAFDVLHVFGIHGAISTQCKHLRSPTPVVLSPILGVQQRPRMRHRVRQVVAQGIHSRGLPNEWAMLAEAFRIADLILPLSGLEAGFISRILGADDKRMHIVPNGVSREILQPNFPAWTQLCSLSDYTLSVGTICPRKNQLKLISASRKNPTQPLVFVGEPGPDADYVSRFKQEVSKDANIAWIPHILPDEVLGAAYADCQIFCLPSLAETQPIAALEAGAHEKPIILSRSDAAAMTPFAGSLQADPRSSESIAECIAAGIEGQGRIDPPATWDDVAKSIQSIYAKIPTKIEPGEGHR